LALGSTLSAAAQGVAGPAVLTAGDLTAIRSVVGATPPQWSPDGSRILIAGTIGGGSDLWTVSPSGGFPVSLGVEMGPISFAETHLPLYSPDGKWISYVSTRTGNPELFLHSLEDGREIQLTRMGAPNGGAAGISSYSWAPDGRSIALANDFSGNFDIYTVAVPSGSVTRLTHDPRH